MRRTLLKAFLALILVLTFSAPVWPSSPAVAQGTPYVIADNAAYVRSGPGIGFWIIDTLSAGESVPVNGVSPDGNWWRVTSTVGEGWVWGPGVSAAGTDSVGVIDPGPIGTVTSAALNVRYGAGINAQKLGTLGRGDQVFVLARNADGSWVQIRWRYGTGWVSASHMDISGAVAQADGDGSIPLTSDTPYGVVLSAYLNVRAGPGINYKVLGQARGGNTLPIIGRTADSAWYQVESPFGDGWVYGAFLATRNEYGSTPVTTASAADAPVSGPIGIINTGALNIRSGPGPQYTSLGALPGGTETQIVGRNADWSWWLLDTPLGTGWASALYIIVRGDVSGVSYVAPGSGGPVGPPSTDAEVPDAVIAAPEAVVTTGALNIRSGPNNTFPTLGAVYAGTRMPIIGQSVDRGWWLVESEFGTGWVSKLYVLVNGNASNIPVRQ